MILADMESLAVIVDNVQATRYVNAAGLVAMFYDHMLTFEDEVQLIWKARTTLPKMLFLFNRYAVPLVLIIKANDFSGLAQLVFSDNYCKGSLSVSTFLGILTIAISNFLVLLRIWVLWDRQKRLMYWTGAAYIAAQISAFAVASSVVSSMLPSMVYDPLFHACVYSRKPNFVFVALWIPGLIFEVLVFILVWWNALDRPRASASQMSNALYRDGVFYFIFLFFLRALNLIMAIIAPTSLLFLGVHSIWCASTIATSHFILNLRRVSVDEGGTSAVDPRPGLLRHSNSPGFESTGTIVDTDFEMRVVDNVKA